MDKFYIFSFHLCFETREDAWIDIAARDEYAARDELASYTFGEGLDMFIMKVELDNVIPFEGLVAL